MAYRKDAREEYLAKLRDPRWQKMRLQVLERDEWVCQRCFDKKSTLHVHHRWYLRGREPWEYPLEALLTLCETCHEEETILTADATSDLPQIVKQAGALGGEMHDLCGAFVTQTMLNEVDWSILVFAIKTLIQSCGSESPEVWHEWYDRYMADASERAEKARRDASAPKTS